MCSYQPQCSGFSRHCLQCLLCARHCQPEQGKVVNSLLFIALDNSTFGEEFAITREDIYEIKTSEGLVLQLSVMAAYKSPGYQGDSQVEQEEDSGVRVQFSRRLLASTHEQFSVSAYYWK